MDDDIKCLNNRQSSKTEFVDHQFLLCGGLKHTEKHTKNAYKSIGYKNICDMAKEPGLLNKDKSFATILSTYRGYDGRNGDVQREHGKFGAIAVDIDHGDKNCETVKVALKTIIGNVDYLIYSTSTAKVDDQKWRTIIPFADLHPYSEIEFVTEALFNRLDEELGGQVCDRKMEKPHMVSFLPNIPYTHTVNGVTTKYRDENGKALFYQYFESNAGERFDPKNCSLTSLAEKLKDEATLRVQASLEERATRQVKALESPGAAPGGNVINVFNQHYSVADLLVEFGYKEMNGRYLSPNQKSGMAGTTLNEDGQVCFIHSDADIQQGIGIEIAGKSCNFADAFDLFTHYEHQGDQRAAVKAAAELLGMNRSRAEDDFSLGYDPQTGEIKELKKSLLGECVDLSNIHLSSPCWVIDNVIPEGVGVVAGSPAVGKTTAVIPLGLAAAGIISHLDKTIAVSIERNVVIFSEDTEQVKRILFGIKEHLITKDNRRAA